MKKGAKIAIGVVGVLIVAGAAVAAWQWNNLNAARYMLTMDGDTISTRLEENSQVLNKAMEDYDISSYTFSPEEISALVDGSLSADDAAKKLLEGDTAVSAPPEEETTPDSSTAPGTSAPTTAPTQSGSSSGRPPMWPSWRVSCSRPSMSMWLASTPMKTARQWCTARWKS